MSNSDFTPPPSGDTPAFTRNKRGAILPTISNIVAAISRPDLCGWHIAYDTALQGPVASPLASDGDWRPLSDRGITKLRITLEEMGFKSVPKGKCKDAVDFVAHRSKVRGVTFEKRA